MASGRGVCVGREPLAEQREPLRNRLRLGDSCGERLAISQQPGCIDTDTGAAFCSREGRCTDYAGRSPPLPLEVGSSAHSGEEAVLTQLNLRLNSLSS